MRIAPADLSLPGLVALRAQALGRPPPMPDEDCGDGWTGGWHFAVRAPATYPVASLRKAFPPVDATPAWAERHPYVKDHFHRLVAELSGPPGVASRRARVGEVFTPVELSAQRTARPTVRLSSYGGRALLDVSAALLRFADTVTGGLDRVDVLGEHAALWRRGRLVGLLRGLLDPRAPGACVARGEFASWEPAWPPLDPLPPRSAAPFSMPPPAHTAQRRVLMARLIGYVRATVAYLGGIELDPDEHLDVTNWAVSTRAGPLYLSVHDRDDDPDPGSVFGRFVDPERVERAFVPGLGPSPSLKWNLHLNDAPHEVALALRQNLAPLALAPEDREPEAILRQGPHANWRVRALGGHPTRWQVYAPGSVGASLDGAMDRLDRALAHAQRLEALERGGYRLPFLPG